MGYDKEREEDYAEQNKVWPNDIRISNIGQNGNNGEHYISKAEEQYYKAIQEKVMDDVPKNKYHKKLAKAEVFIDVYDVLDAYKVENPAIQHAIKKMLCAGSRGYKDFQQDVQEAIDSLERAKDFPPVPF